MDERNLAPSVTNKIFTKVVTLILADTDAGAYLMAQHAAHSNRTGELTALKTAPGTDLTTVVSAALRPQPPRRRPPLG